MDFDIVENFCVDVAVSFGPNCRAAEALRRNGIRFFASPFDWMMKYELGCIYDILKQKGKDFGADFKQDLNIENGKFRYMVSESTGMVSVHHFRKNISVKEAYLVFKHKMDKRFLEMDKLFNDAENICIVSSREIEVGEIKAFIDKFLELYSFKKICYINIFSTEDKECIEEYHYDNITIYQCYFEDVNPEVKKSADKKDWKGNTEYWDNILRKISLNQNFVARYRRNKKFADLFSTDLRLTLKVCYINAKCKILRFLKITCD